MAFAWLTGSRPNQHPFLGAIPAPLYGESAPDGDAHPFKGAPVGTLYVRRVDSTHVQYWVKGTDNNLDGDWRIQQGLITQRFVKANFTDGGSTSGTLVLTTDIPAGAFVDRVLFNITTAFSGDTSADIDLGDGSDADRWVAASGPSAFTTGYKDGGAPSGTILVATAATTPTITITSTADFTNVAAGVGYIYVTYHM